jgi:hypothetical protein
MSTKKQPQPAEPQKQAVSKGVATELSNEAVRNLAGYFDMLIQMDFALKQRNAQRSKEDEASHDKKMKKNRYIRFSEGILHEHEFYKIKGFITMFDAAPEEDLVTLATCKDEERRLILMHALAAHYLMDEDDEGK